MSALPFAQESARDWWGVALIAFSAHVVVAAAGIGVMVWHPDPAPTPPEISFTVSLQRLDTDSLAGTQVSEGIANAADTPGNDAPDDQPEGVSASSPEVPDLPSDTDQQAPLLPAPDRQPARLASVPQLGRDVAEITPPDAPVVPDAPASLDLAQPPVSAAPLPLASTQTPEASSPIIPLDRGQSTGGAPRSGPQLATLQPPGAAAEDQSPDWPSPPPEASSLDGDTTPNVGESDHASTDASEAGDTASLPEGEGNDTETRATVARAVDLAAGDLIRRIREQAHPDCLVALPRRTSTGGLGLEMIGASERVMQDYAKALLGPEDADLVQTRQLIDPRQCAGLDLVAKGPNYPATRLGLGLENPAPASSGWLRGGVRGTGGRYVMLLVIDNNGVVQDLQRFSRFGDNRVDFAVPVTRAGPRRDTSQLILALASSTPFDDLRSGIGGLAHETLQHAQDQLGPDIAMALTGFVLQ